MEGHYKLQGAGGLKGRQFKEKYLYQGKQQLPVGVGWK